jgi:hypothetical protein
MITSEVSVGTVLMHNKVPNIIKALILSEHKGDYYYLDALHNYRKLDHTLLFYGWYTICK